MSTVATAGGMARTPRAAQLRLPIGVFLSLAFLAVVVVCALVPSLIATHSPTKNDFAQLGVPPGAAHWFGTDQLGRDVFSRVVYGARLSLLIGVVATLIGATIGGLLGLFAGSSGRVLDGTVMRLTDIMLAFPGVMLALAIIAARGPSTANLILAIGIGAIPQYVRLMRGQVLSIRRRPYMEAAVASGSRWPVMVFRHLLPNALSPLLVLATIGMGISILAASGPQLPGSRPTAPGCGVGPDARGGASVRRASSGGPSRSPASPSCSRSSPSTSWASGCAARSTDGRPRRERGPGPARGPRPGHPVRQRSGPGPRGAFRAASMWTRARRSPWWGSRARASPPRHARCCGCCRRRDRIHGGSILFEGRDLVSLPEPELRRVRGDRISMVFQEPMSSLNPVHTVGGQIAEVLRLHRDMGRREAGQEAIGLLEQVGIGDAALRARQYPHNLSGGMQQRVMIAMALACSPAPAHRGRADHGARRHGPGPDPGPPPRHHRAHRHRGAAHHARPRRRGGHRRPGGGDGAGGHRRIRPDGGRPRRPEAPLHAAAAGRPTLRCGPARSS